MVRIVTYIIFLIPWTLQFIKIKAGLETEPCSRYLFAKNLSKLLAKR